MVERALVKWTPEQLAVIKNTVARGASDTELALFSMICGRTGLDPFTRQIYLIQRRVQEEGQWKTVMTPQTGIDGYRVIAERTGKYAGQDAPLFEYKAERLNAATVAVYRTDFPRPLVATAFWDEYVQTNTQGEPIRMWKKMPHNQLAKCAEALALRKAFPQDLSGIYTHEEMEQADTPEAPTVDSEETIESHEPLLPSAIAEEVPPTEVPLVATIPKRQIGKADIKWFASEMESHAMSSGEVAQALGMTLAGWLKANPAGTVQDAWRLVEAWIDKRASRTPRDEPLPDEEANSPQPGDLISEERIPF